VGLVLILVFVVLPLIELAVFVQFTHWIGALDSLLLLFAVSVGGVFIVRHQGLGVWRRVRAQLSAGTVPAAELVDGLLILIAGLLLIIPGFVTDAVGLLLLVPPVRGFVRGRLRKRYSVRVASRVVKVVNTRGSAGNATTPDPIEVLPPAPRQLPPTPPDSGPLDGG
jgi:UPF0716 protein FxsA